MRWQVVAFLIMLSGCSSVRSQYNARVESCDVLPDARQRACYERHPIEGEPSVCMRYVNGAWTKAYPQFAHMIEAESAACRYEAIESHEQWNKRKQIGRAITAGQGEVGKSERWSLRERRALRRAPAHDLSLGRLRRARRWSQVMALQQDERVYVSGRPAGDAPERL